MISRRDVLKLGAAALIPAIPAAAKAATAPAPAFLPTGISKIDALLGGGFQPGDLVLLQGHFDAQAEFEAQLEAVRADNRGAVGLCWSSAGVLRYHAQRPDRFTHVVIGRTFRARVSRPGQPRTMGLVHTPKSPVRYWATHVVNAEYTVHGGLSVALFKNSRGPTSGYVRCS